MIWSTLEQSYFVSWHFFSEMVKHLFYIRLTNSFHLLESYRNYVLNLMISFENWVHDVILFFVFFFRLALTWCITSWKLFRIKESFNLQPLLLIIESMYFFSVLCFLASWISLKDFIKLMTFLILLIYYLHSDSLVWWWARILSLASKNCI